MQRIVVDAARPRKVGSTSAAMGAVRARITRTRGSARPRGAPGLRRRAGDVRLGAKLRRSPNRMSERHVQMGHRWTSRIGGGAARPPDLSRHPRQGVAQAEENHGNRRPR